MDSKNLNRLHDPEDFVRREIELAFEVGARAIPVLVEDDPDAQARNTARQPRRTDSPQRRPASNQP